MQTNQHYPKTSNSAGAAARKPVRSYTKPPAPKYVIPPVSRFKCKVWFLDGNKKCFYSYDTKQTTNGQTIVDQWEGLMKLMRMIEGWKGRYKTVMIWANLDPVPMTELNKYDYLVHKSTRYTNETADLNFHVSGELDVERIKYAQAKQWYDQSKSNENGAA